MTIAAPKTGIESDLNRMLQAGLSASKRMGKDAPSSTRSRLKKQLKKLKKIGDGLILTASGSLRSVSDVALLCPETGLCRGVNLTPLQEAITQIAKDLGKRSNKAPRRIMRQLKRSDAKARKIIKKNAATIASLDSSLKRHVLEIPSLVSECRR